MKETLWNYLIIVKQVNTLFETMTRVMMENEGDIDKFMGDACMSFWLVEQTEDVAKNVMDTIISLKNEIIDMNKNNDLFKEDPIIIRIGINAGDVILCDIGAENARIDLTIIGDSVNIAARLESASAHYGVENLIR